jgi:hypothetical protein
MLYGMPVVMGWTEPQSPDLAVVRPREADLRVRERRFHVCTYGHALARKAHGLRQTNERSRMASCYGHSPGMGRSVTARVFRTRRAIITLTDTTLIYEPKREPQRRVSIARADITEVRLVTHVYWHMPVRLEVLVHHRGGTLSIPQVGRRTAERLREALGFKPFGQ